jgi:hypothetical protein
MCSDIFVIYDTAQYSKENFHNRNKLKFNNQDVLLTVPVPSNSWRNNIKDVNMIDSVHLKKIWKTISIAYGKTPFFNVYSDCFKEIFHTESSSLCSLNCSIIIKTLELFGYKGQIVYSSKLGLDPTLRKTDALLQIVKQLNGTVYVSGSSGMNYLDEAAFTREHIRVIYQKFKPFAYKQTGHTFIPYLGVLDYIFNEGSRVPDFHNVFITSLNE